jgi:hypothetical protein
VKEARRVTCCTLGKSHTRLMCLKAQRRIYIYIYLYVYVYVYVYMYIEIPANFRTGCFGGRGPDGALTHFLANLLMAIRGPLKRRSARIFWWEATERANVLAGVFAVRCRNGAHANFVADYLLWSSTRTWRSQFTNLRKNMRKAMTH